MTEKKFKINGTVRFAGVQKDEQGINEKQVVTLALTDETLAKVVDAIGDTFGYDANPIKENKEGITYFKAQTSFDVDVFENGSPSDLTLSDIGRDSEVTLFCKLKEVGKRKKFIVAYLLSVNVIKLVPYEKFNAFEDDDIEEM